MPCFLGKELENAFGADLTYILVASMAKCCGSRTRNVQHGWQPGRPGILFNVLFDADFYGSHFVSVRLMANRFFRSKKSRWLEKK